MQSPHTKSMVNKLSGLMPPGTTYAANGLMIRRSRGRTGVAAIVAAAALVASHAPADAATIAFWSGNGTTTSSAGSHTGTLENGAGYGAGQFGQQAFSLVSSSSQYVAVPDSPAWDFGTSPFTIAMYVNFSSINTNPFNQGGNALIGRSEGGGTTNKWFFSYLSDGSLGFALGSSGAATAFFTSPSTAVLSTGTWNLLAVTRSGSTYTFYSNGASLGTASNSDAYPAIAGALTIGQIGESLGYLNGRMQNVAIFDTAMTASEIAAAVPEPSTWAMALAGLACGCWRLRRHKPAGGPRLSSLS
jgi:hypothetical protein